MDFILNYVNNILNGGIEAGEIIILFALIFMWYQNYCSKKKLKNIDTAVNNSNQDENPKHRGVPIRETINRTADRVEEVVSRLDRVETKVDQHINAHAERRL